jgi:hypothetical protein
MGEKTMKVNKVFKIVVITLGVVIAIGGIYFNYYLITHDPSKETLISFDNDMNYLDEFKLNSERLCVGLWPGVEEIQKECISKQYIAAKELYSKYVYPYVINRELTILKDDEIPKDVTNEEKEYLIKKCMERSQTILPDNSFALDYIETLTCCEYSFKLYGFE